MNAFGIPLFPDQASTFAADVDALYFFILSVCAFFALTVAVLVIYFGFRYHKAHDAEIGARIEGSLPLELLWSVISGGKQHHRTAIIYAKGLSATTENPEARRRADEIIERLSRLLPKTQ